MWGSKSPGPNIKVEGKEFLASELAQLFRAIQSPSMSYGDRVDERIGELRTVVSEDYRDASGLPSTCLPANCQASWKRKSSLARKPGVL